MRYDDPRGSPRGHRPEGIPAVAMETQTLEQIEEESIGGDSEVEVLEPLEGHRSTWLSIRCHIVDKFLVDFFVLSTALL